MNFDITKVKIITFVPKTHANAVRNAMGDAGAGKIGNYSHCSYNSLGSGMYKPLDGANPFIGKVGEFETVTEEKIEMVCDLKVAKNVISAMKLAHPYEEVAFDIIPLIDETELF